jgi:hypothetical protein
MSRKKPKPRIGKPFWERGYNGHVFWHGKTKLGKVTVHAGKDKPTHKYTWEAAGKAGASDDLDQARKAVEFAVHVKDKQLDLFG